MWDVLREKISSQPLMVRGNKSLLFGGLSDAEKLMGARKQGEVLHSIKTLLRIRNTFPWDFVLGTRHYEVEDDD